MPPPLPPWDLRRTGRLLSSLLHPLRLQGPSLLSWVCRIHLPHTTTPPAAVRGGGGRASPSSTRTAAAWGAVHGAARRGPSRPRLDCGKRPRRGGRRALRDEIMEPCSRNTEGIQAGAASLHPAAQRWELPGYPLPWTQEWGPVVASIL